MTKAESVDPLAPSLVEAFTENLDAMLSIVVQWIPAHCFDQIPIEFITQDMANATQTTLQHISCNRYGDKFAKEEAAKNAAIATCDKDMLYKAILQRQNWLTKVGEPIYVDIQELRLQQFQKRENDRVVSTKLSTEEQEEISPFEPEHFSEGVYLGPLRCRQKLNHPASGSTQTMNGVCAFNLSATRIASTRRGLDKLR